MACLESTVSSLTEENSALRESLDVAYGRIADLQEQLAAPPRLVSGNSWPAEALNKEGDAPNA